MWTTEQKVEFYLDLPWTLELSTEDGELVARVREVPGIVATGVNERALHADLRLVLEEAIGVLVEHDDPITLPIPVALPWNEGKEPPAAIRRTQFSRNAEAIQDVIARSSASNVFVRA